MEKHKLQEIQTFPPPPQPKSQLPPPTPPITSVELAGIAISLKARLKSTNMPPLMQEHAMRSTRSLVDSAPKSKSRPNPSYIARSLKQEFDTKYGPAWHCIVGTSFGSFVTHSPGGFIYFSMDDSLSFLLFKTEVKLVQS